METTLLVMLCVWSAMGIPLRIEFFAYKHRFPVYTKVGKCFAVLVCGPFVWLFYLGSAIGSLMIKLKLPQLYERVMVKPEHWVLQEYNPKPVPTLPARNIRVIPEKKKRWWSSSTT